MLKKIINIVLILGIILNFFPVSVFALVDNKSSSELNNILKDDSIDYDFLINIAENDSINILYNKVSLENYLKQFIIDKLSTYDVSILINNVDESLLTASYSIVQNDDIYNGTLKYSFNYDIDLVTDNNDFNINDLISSYFKSNYSIENIEILNISNNSYKIIYDGVSNVFNFNVTVNNLNDASDVIVNNEENIVTEDVSTYDDLKNISVSYSTHIQDQGWTKLSENGEFSGTTGLSRRMEAIKIQLKDSKYEGSIKYQTYVQNYGWLDYVSNGELGGTSGQSLRMEAIKIKLDGDISNYYDVYYRVYIQNYGWLKWSMNDEITGSSCLGLRIEGIEIRLVDKGSYFDVGSGVDSYIVPQPSLTGSVQVQNYGWIGYSNVMGTMGQSLRIEAIKMNLTSYRYSGDVLVQSYIEGLGWNDWTKSNEINGTVGKSLRMEAIKIKLDGDISNYYDVYYRAYIQNYGWLGWSKNGEEAGSRGLDLRMESLQVELVPKNSNDSKYDSSIVSYINPEFNVVASAQVQNYGWMSESNLVGTTNKALRMEAIKLRMINPDYSGDLKVQAYVQNYGWMNEVSQNEIAGTVGKSLRMEAIKINLTDKLADNYDIYYRAYIENYGWLDWAKNGEEAGSRGLSYRMESIQIKVVKKGDVAPGDTTKPLIAGKWVIKDGNTYYYDEFGKMADDFKVIDGVKYFFNSLGVLKGSNVRKVIDVSSHNGIIDWDMVKNSDVDAVILRVSAGSAYEDSQLFRNVSELKRLNIPYGIYLYSYAENQLGMVSDLGQMEEGALEAQRIINVIKKYNMNLSLPIYYDLEVWKSKANSFWTSNDYSPIITSFANKMSEYGYDFKIYTNKLWAESALINYKDKINWIAQYNHNCTYDGTYSGWQFSSTESIPGIIGNVDVSVWFN